MAQKKGLAEAEFPKVHQEELTLTDALCEKGSNERGTTSS